MKAERLPDGQIKLTGNAWSDVFPADRLQGWIKWYDQMHTDYGHESYRETADVLRAV